ncbi:hypothetical protein SUBVAR_04085 [Subdoligranulum variabile DSM 15176]|uniref:Uncharacterized protein n=1 Tax=Subdoligranulum variabile DSM 15176 TaxID=411471 RepID=D1PIC0_9FIRM|nr:hypothetical protein SUBVAR_04085 [Subdoligranulum variabile DSM 15176]
MPFRRPCPVCTIYDSGFSESCQVKVAQLCGVLCQNRSQEKTGRPARDPGLIQLWKTLRKIASLSARRVVLLFENLAKKKAGKRRRFVQSAENRLECRIFFEKAFLFPEGRLYCKPVQGRTGKTPGILVLFLFFMPRVRIRRRGGGENPPSCAKRKICTGRGHGTG